MLPDNHGPVLSVIHDERLRYPGPTSYFSPSESFPEYPFSHLSQEPNAAYSAVRNCLAEAGLDAGNFGTSKWNPLSGYIRPGQSVFILCNFVKQNISSDPDTLLAKCTHGSVIRAIIDYVLLALGGRGCVRFGNAPLQSADWSRVTAEVGAQRVREFYATNLTSNDTRVELVDLRQHIVHRSSLGVSHPLYHGDDTQCSVPIDLKSDSMLEPLYDDGVDPRFRVLDYDYHRTERCHGNGRHTYLLNKMIIDSDVVISVPKLKTHEKVGITCGIKGCVGTVSHKDCLAHHRYGSAKSGGDEYPDRLSFLLPLSELHDKAYSMDPGRRRSALCVVNHLSRVAVRRVTRALSGSWPGNDTCWRMAIDLARIIEYADKQGCLQPVKQRAHLMVTDGIIAGEGDGPLSPKPVSMGYVSFSDNVAAGDYINCLAMGFDPDKIPLVREAFQLRSWPLAGRGDLNSRIHVDGRSIGAVELRSMFSVKFAPPREWRNYL